MNNCCCIDSYDDGPEFSTQQLQRARKPHQCCECHKTILAGSLYERVSGVWDGQFQTYKTCARCANIRNDYFPYGWYYTRLVEDFRDCFGFDYRDGIPADFAPCKGKTQEQTP